MAATANKDIAAGDAVLRASSGRSNPLLFFGIVPVFLFTLLVVAQVATREGFSLIRMPLSLLAVGEGGWVQAANFIINGLLLMIAAIGVFRSLPPGIRRTIMLVALLAFGSGMVLAGIFPSDPIDGFPQGARQPDLMSENAQRHGLGFMIAQTGLFVACCTSAWMFARKDSKWSWISAFTAVALPLIIVAGFSHPPTMGIAFFTVGSMGLGWVSLLCWRLRRGR